MPPEKSSGKNSTVGVIGTINRDTIYHPDGRRIDSWGGLLYSLKYLNDHSGAKILPAINVGSDCFDDISAIVGRMANIDSSHVRKVDAKNNHCHLFYANETHKCEHLEGSVPPLTYTRVKSLSECDMILVNFISGNDISLSALERLRCDHSGKIYTDVHSLTLGRRRFENGFRRHLRRPRCWQRYVACADIIQINRVEFSILSGNDCTEMNVRKFFRDELRHAVCLNVTLGNQGALVLHRVGRKVRTALIPAVRVGKVYDTTGCGDIFAAGFISAYIKNHDPIEAAKHGNRLAAERVRFKGKMF